MSPYLPVTPDEIAESAIGAAEAGAAIVHLHARDPKTGAPDQSPALFEKFLPRIKQTSNVVINLTSGGAATMPVAERAGPARALKPEVSSLNMGSMNFGLYPMLDRFKEFKHDWERPYLEGSRDRIFRNTFKDIEFILEACSGNGTRFEFECYDTGHLYNLAHFLDRGLVKPPLFVQTVFGILGGIGTHPDDVMHQRRTADRLFGRENYQWSVLGAGRNSNAYRRDGRRDGRQRSCRSGRFTLAGCGQTRAVECRASEKRAPDHRRPWPRHRLARRGARDAGAKRWRQGGLLIGMPMSRLEICQDNKAFWRNDDANNI